MPVLPYPKSINNKEVSSKKAEHICFNSDSDDENERQKAKVSQHINKKPRVPEDKNEW